MWYQTKATQLLGVQYPIIQGPFGGGLSSAALVSAVSNAGGLGGYGVHHLPPERIVEVDREIRLQTNKPYALNLWVSDIDDQATHYSSQEFHHLQELWKPYFNALTIPLPEMPAPARSKFSEQIETLLRIQPPVLSFIFGIPPKEVLRDCKKRGIITIGAATTPDEAIALEEADVDVIVASGFEAGGHRPSFLRAAEDSLMGTFSLLPQIVDAVQTPVIAAGGIADARGIVAAFTLGASAVQIGTAFLACAESNATTEHKRTLFSNRAKYTTLTTAFTGRLARGTKSTISEEMKQHAKTTAPFPLHSAFIGPLRAAALAQQQPEKITFWAGQSAPMLKHTTASSLIQFLIEQTEALYASFGKGHLGGV